MSEPTIYGSGQGYDFLNKSAMSSAAGDGASQGAAIGGKSMGGGGNVAGQISGWAAGGATVTAGAAQTLYGLYLQKKNKRPEYQIPQEVFQNLTQAQQAALEGMPEEQRMQYIQNIQRGTATGLSQLGSRKAGVAGLAVLNQQQNDAYANIAAQDAAMKQQNQQQVLDARQNLADYRDQQFQLNKLNPYYEKVQEAQGMLGAGMQNVTQGFQMGM